MEGNYNRKEILVDIEEDPIAKDDDIVNSYIFIDKIKPTKKSADLSWSEYIRKSYNTTSIFFGIAVVYLYFLYKKPSKSASNL